MLHNIKRVNLTFNLKSLILKIQSIFKETASLRTVMDHVMSHTQLIDGPHTKCIINNALKIYEFINEVGIDKKYLNKNYSAKIPALAFITAKLSQWHVMNC